VTVAAVAATAILAAGSWATPGSDPRADLDVAYGTTAPGGISTSVSLHVLYKHPDDRNAKPPALTKASFELHPGTRIDNTAVAQCAATDAELQLRGRDACPPASQVGQGSLTVMSGSPGDPMAFDSTVFNGRGELIELVTVKGTNTTAGLDRLTIAGSTLRANPPAIPGGPPDGRTAVREITLVLPARSVAGRPYIVTPGDCPADGLWRTRGSFEFTDGGRSSVTSTSACDPPKPAPAAISLRVTPSSVPAGRRTRFTLRATSRAGGCVGGVTVRIGGVRATTDRLGRATLFARLTRGTRAWATKRGCRPATAPIRVRAAR
jgi:hypothetical protein